MKEFVYTIIDPDGIHARPAGLLVKEAGSYNSEITIEKNGSKANAKKIFAVMGLGAKHGEQIRITVSGEDEEEAYAALKKFAETNL